MTVYALSLGAALLFGAGSVVQQHAAAEAPPDSVLRLRLLLWLVRRPLWLAGVATAVVGNVLSGAALAVASVALVQPLLATRLLFALPLAATWRRRRVPRRDWAAALVAACGLAAFVAAGQPQEATGGPPAWWRWVLATAAGGVAAGLAVALTRRAAPTRRAPVLGAAAGVLFGLQAALTHTAMGHLTSGGLLALLTSWPVYAVVVAAVSATLLAQSAYEMAPLTASYPAIATVEPLAGIGLSLGVLGGSLDLSPANLAVEIVALAAMSAGIWLLATSPLVTGHHE